ncbi:response regulator transcription factor [Shimia sp.]|uniref:helix-turn-helix transcriptional regulator n=1 Tax=Shimia sp. TaxID=1954381 RepID=UPI003BAC5395
MNSAIVFDKNPCLASSLATQLSSETSIQCEGYAFEKDLLLVVECSKPKVVIVDPAHLDLSQSYDISDFQNSVCDVSPETKLLCYSFEVTNSMVQAVTEAGFHGCISKYSTFRQLELAIEVVMGGGVYFDKFFSGHVLNTGDQGKDDVLSKREKEVLVGIANGLASKQIAYDLNISAKTVETYKSRASGKLGLSDRAQVVEYARSSGWI